jgi:hypothetical protein
VSGAGWGRQVLDKCCTSVFGRYAELLTIVKERIFRALYHDYVLPRDEPERDQTHWFRKKP